MVGPDKALLYNVQVKLNLLCFTDHLSDLMKLMFDKSSNTQLQSSTDATSVYKKPFHTAHIKNMALLLCALYKTYFNFIGYE